MSPKKKTLRRQQKQKFTILLRRKNKNEKNVIQIRKVKKNKEFCMHFRKKKVLSVYQFAVLSVLSSSSSHRPREKQRAKLQRNNEKIAVHYFRCALLVVS